MTATTAGYDFLAGELVKRDAEIQQLRMQLADHGETITRLETEIERLTSRLADLKIENWQLKGALGYEVPGQIPPGDFKCGLCEARAGEMDSMRMVLAETQQWNEERCAEIERLKADGDGLLYEELMKATAEITRLQGELRRVRGR